MWGAIAGIFAAATVLALSQSFLESISKGKDQEVQKPSQLPEPDPKFKNHPKNWSAPLWQEGTAKDILDKVQRMRSKFKK